MLTSRSSGVRRFARIVFAVRMLGSIRRVEWLYRSKGRVPRGRIDRHDPLPAKTEELELCQRLIAAYSKASERDRVTRSTEGMWSWIFDTCQRELAATLERGDAEALARLMASMFQRDFLLGLASGPLISHTHSKLASRIWCLKSFDMLVSLAEALSVVPVENPEQGSTGLAFEAGVGELLVRLERKLGFRLDFPDVGAPAGLAVEGRLITPDTPEQIYAAVRLDEAICLHLDRRADAANALRVVEIGGGDGGMCYWYLKRRDGVASYTIVDLPIVNVIQGYFLARALGPKRVSFHGEPPTQVKIAPDFALAEVESPFEVLVNKDSMPEMPRVTMMDYLEWGATNCEGLFYSYNQEVQAEVLGEAQGVVHEAIAEMGRFERLRRDESWVRRGYVEEIYVPARKPSAHAEPRRTADSFCQMDSPAPTARATAVRD